MGRGFEALASGGAAETIVPLSSSLIRPTVAASSPVGRILCCRLGTVSVTGCEGTDPADEASHLQPALATESKALHTFLQAPSTDAAETPQLRMPPLTCFPVSRNLGLPFGVKYFPGRTSVAGPLRDLWRPCALMGGTCPPGLLVKVRQ